MRRGFLISGVGSVLWVWLWLGVIKLGRIFSVDEGAGWDWLGKEDCVAGRVRVEGMIMVVMGKSENGISWPIVALEYWGLFRSQAGT